jgi:hypothetical protein
LNDDSVGNGTAFPHDADRGIDRKVAQHWLGTGHEKKSYGREG